MKGFAPNFCPNWRTPSQKRRSTASGFEAVLLVSAVRSLALRLCNYAQGVFLGVKVSGDRVAGFVGHATVSLFREHRLIKGFNLLQ